jgi:hypothetical protein
MPPTIVRSFCMCISDRSALGSAGGQPLVVSLALDAELPAAALAAMSCVFSDGSRPGFNVIFAPATAAADGKSVRAGG